MPNIYVHEHTNSGTPYLSLYVKNSWVRIRVPGSLNDLLNENDHEMVDGRVVRRDNGQYTGVRLIRDSNSDQQMRIDIIADAEHVCGDGYVSELSTECYEMGDVEVL